MWAGEHVALDGALAICQQIPLRVHVGLSESGSQAKPFKLTLGAEPGDHVCYDMEEDRIRQFQWGQRAELISRAGFGPTLSLVLTRLGQHLGLRGEFVVRTLHEMPLESGVDWSGAFSSALVGALFAASGKWDGSEITVEDPILPELNLWAWRVERILHGGRASGYGIMVSILPYPQPVLYVGELCPAADDELPSLRPFTRPLCDTETWHARAAFGYGLITTGVPKSTAEAIKRVREVRSRDLANGVERARQLWPAPTPDGGPLVQPMGEVPDTADGLVSCLLSAVRLAGIDVLSALLQQVEQGPTRGAVLLAEALNAVGHALDSLGLAWPEELAVRAALQLAFGRRGGAQQVGVKLTGGGGGGCLVFVCDRLDWHESGAPVRGSLAEAFDGGLVDARSHGAPLARLLWSASRDDLAGEGLLSEKRRDQDAAEVARDVAQILLSLHQVVPGYYRADQNTHALLHHHARMLQERFADTQTDTHTLLISGPSGAGKTAFAEAVARAAGVRLVNINMVKHNADEIADRLRALEGGPFPAMCVVDEIDKDGAQDHYAQLFPHLDQSYGGVAIFVLIGSLESSIDRLIARIKASPAGADIITRIDTRIEIASATLADRATVFCAGLLSATRADPVPITAIMGSALFFVLADDAHQSLRELTHWAKETRQRCSRMRSDTVTYDDLFDDSTLTRKVDFRERHSAVMRELDVKRVQIAP
jgi:mevalonate kinase